MAWQVDTGLASPADTSSSSGNGGGWSPGVQHSGMPTTTPTTGDGGADIDATYSAADAYFEPTYEKTLADKVIDYYKGGGLLGMGMRKIGGMLNPENQYEGIVGETDYGAGDYVSTIADWAESRGLTDNYASEDSETQMFIDKQMWDAGIRSPSFEVFYEGGGDSSTLEGLTGSESSALEQLITPSLPGLIGGEQLPPSVYDTFFSNISKAGENIMNQYNLAKAKTNNFITTPMTTASYGIFEDARLRGLI
jgi:hypothetical protein|tara:strand:- start:1513 stop:2265 length:753 start_codon:yes stop_codon:yes gene_type:complete